MSRQDDCLSEVVADRDRLRGLVVLSGIVSGSYTYCAHCGSEDFDYDRPGATTQASGRAYGSLTPRACRHLDDCPAFTKDGDLK